MWPEVDIVKTEQKRELKLSGSAISDKITKNGIDNDIFLLTSLNLLNISDTTLEHVPENISNLKNLQTLMLFGNKITNLPQTLFNLDKLKLLDLSRNQLCTIPPEINNLNNLTSINLSGNNITKFPTIEHFTKLLTIDLSNNQLSEFPELFFNNNNLSEINLKTNLITSIPDAITHLSNLKVLNLSANKILAVPKSIALLQKLKDLHLEDNPIKDKRLLKLIQQCRTKQIVDYVKAHGADVVKKESTEEDTTSVSSATKKSTKEEKVEAVCKYKLNVIRHTDDTIQIILKDDVKTIRPYILCCLIKDVQITEDLFKNFLQIQTKLHDTVCMKREVAAIATHDLDKIVGKQLFYTAKNSKAIKIQPLGRSTKISGEKYYQQLKLEAENLRKEKKRNIYSGIHKYLYLLENKNMYSCLEDTTGNVLSLHPLTNSDLTKITTETKNIFVEVTSNVNMDVCKKCIDTLLYEMLINGFTTNQQPNELLVQQIKIIDIDGNLKNVYPSKVDLVDFEENFSINVVRE